MQMKPVNRVKRFFKVVININYEHSYYCISIVTETNTESVVDEKNPAGVKAGINRENRLYHGCWCLDFLRHRVISSNDKKMN